MSKREKNIIIILLIVGIVAGIYILTSYLGKNNELSQIQELEELDDVKAEISRQLSKGKLSDTEIYTMELARNQWQDQAFQIIEKITIEDEDNDEEIVEIDDSIAYGYVYSGYVKAGKKIFGIIDNVEYQSGEEVDGGGGYHIMLITPEKVIVTKEGREIPLFLTE